MCIKTKTNKNTADKCIKTYYVSWFTYLKLHNLSVLRHRNWRQAFFSLPVFFFSLSFCVHVQYVNVEAVSLSQWRNQASLRSSPAKSLILTAELKKGAGKWEHIRYKEPKLWELNVLQNAFMEIHSQYVHSWHFSYLFEAMVTWALNWYYTQHPKHTKIQLSLNLLRVRHFCN